MQLTPKPTPGQNPASSACEDLLREVGA